MNFPGNDEDPNDLEIEIDFFTVELKTARNAAKDAAVKRLVYTNAQVYHPGLKASITFTKTGIKECINQPFSKFREKLKLIYEGLEEAIKLSIYDHDPQHPDPNKPKVGHIVSYHYLETVIGGETAYFNVQLTNQGHYVLYTITDNRKDKKSAQRA